MKIITSISIGIPAYNEGANIKQLLQVILAQKGTNFNLQKIFVLSDGSTDNTASKVRSLNDKRIVLKDEKMRLGKSARMEQILRLNTSDVLIFIDADIFIKDKALFSKLVASVDFKISGIATINAQPLAPKTFFERTLDAGVYATKRISEQWNNGDNYLSFRGCFLALSKDLVRNIHMPSKVVNNDAYLYFAAVKNGFKPVYVPKCSVFYCSPVTLSDHINQSSRFQHSRKELFAYFNNIQNAYNVPTGIMIKSMAQALVAKNFFFLTYLITNIITKLKKEGSVNPIWKIASSTKQKFVLFL